MIDLTVYNRKGQEVDSLNVDESILGGSVRYPLLKQAVVMYQANKRVGTAATKSRGMVAGSTAKVFRQKGTGRARIGNIRTGKRVGGGATFGKVTRDFSKRMPKKQRKLARDSAVLAKLLNGDVVVIDELDFEKPRTADFAGILDNLRIDRSCLVTTSDYNENLCKSARNVPRIAIMPVAELNAGDICNYRKMLFTKEAFMTFLGRSEDSESQ
ncbi:MAG: 50S ribosomal protein L4 [Planctomycetota bacterium]|jgi:large subunit ribosomal protein L4